jgi:RND family efflux transporter MFP subunit
MSNVLPPDGFSESTGGRTRRIRWILVVLALVISGWGIAERVHARKQLAEETRQAAIPNVITVRPQPSVDGEALQLSGTAQAFAEAPIYARTSGYVKSWSKDIGAHVRKGAVLALIDTPEIDQQFRQAHADVETARAAYRIAESTDERWKGLLATDSVSRQEADQREADASMKRAALESAEANLARLKELQDFKRIVAPFDGVVTQRATDIGALVTAGQNAGSPLFRVADVHRLRIYSAIPETYARQIRVGLTADVSFDGRAGRVKATVVSTAEAIDPTSRTLQIEMQVDNAHGDLLPGAYARVHFDLGPQSGLPRLPVTALLFRSDGLWVATVRDDQHAHLKKVVPARDFGTDIEIREGLDPKDVVIVNPPDSLMEGAPVRVVTGKGH